MYCAKKRGRRRFEFHAAVPSAGNGVPAIDVDPPELARPRDEPPAEHAELVLRDLREANEQLLLAALTARDEQAKAEATQRRQARLLSIMAHELRNPTAPCRLAMETRRQRFVLALPAAPSQVDADVARLVEVFCKLLDNASDGLPLQGARGSACTDGRC